ncbi:MAG: CapA family protein [Alphaproteobacteria bacterium]|nr:CapA family protein [Alphaproteobacteria bacterium]
MSASFAEGLQQEACRGWVFRDLDEMDQTTVPIVYEFRHPPAGIRSPRSSWEQDGLSRGSCTRRPPMTLLFALLGCLAHAEDPLPGEDHYQAGVAALAEKDAAAASAALRACTEAAPERGDCWWELGWARWIAGDWEGVIQAWETVKRLEPDNAQVDQHIGTARGNLEVQRMIAASAKDAPDTLRAPPPEGATLRLRAAGDVMLGTDFPEGNLPPNDGAGLLDGVAEALRDADLTFINLEGPLCDSGRTTKCGEGSNCYAFRTPTRYGRYLAEVGVDLASTANNHTNDFGAACRLETEAALDKLGIAYSGRPGTIATVEANGLKVGMIGFHTSDTCHNLNDTETAAALVQAVAKDHDLVIVSFHGGAEGSKATHVPNGMESFYGEQRGNLRVFTHAVVDAGADLVIGHGPHVLRGMEVYQDRLIAYSLGNFATYGRFNLSGYLGVGAILDVTLAADGRFVSGQLLATQQEGEGVPSMDPEGRAIDLVRSLTEDDFPTTGVLVAKDGSIGRR